MRTASFAPASTATQSLLATRKEATRNLCESVEGRIESLRNLISGTRERGFLARLAMEMKWRPERTSRELARVEKLSVALLVAAAELHRQEGRASEADSILAALSGSAPHAVRTKGGIVIRIVDGQMQLDFTGDAE
jgi:hypothetical protein